jgi:BRCA1-associated protein
LTNAEKEKRLAQSDLAALKRELTELKKTQEGHVLLQKSDETALRTRLSKLEADIVPRLESSREKLERKLEKATELARSLHRDLDNERSVTRGLMDNIGSLKEENERRKAESADLSAQVKDLSEQVQDLMFTLTAQERIKDEGGSGGDMQVQQKTAPARRKKK